MGGKHNLANRTKNNARPSSSGRSAAMLNSSLPQFGGFSGLKESSGLSLLTFCPIEEFDPALEESFQLAIKKISKKDSTTKLKGLQEFAELVKNADPEVVKAVLPIWPRFYSILATDSDNRVREATHHVHHKIVVKVKRNIAPYLKQIMATWFTSQYDNYPPAATAAVQAFKDTFSEGKFQEAIIFCRDEILYYIYEVLSVQMVPNKAGNTVLPQDAEADAKYERILISCLQGYSLYLQKVPEEKIKESAALNFKIVLNKRFWKFATGNIAVVRAAWFQVLSNILQNALFLFKDKESQVLNTTLLYLEDDDPVVVPHVWDCLLLATSLIPDWCSSINVERLLIPKLIKILQQAGTGNASIIYPNLLPLLSNLPTMDKENEFRFCNSFFEAMRLGLKLKTGASSKSELTAIVAAFIECLQFLIIKQSFDIDFGKSLIKHHLVPTIEWCCITEDVSCYKTIYYHTSIFIQYLSRSNSSELSLTLVKFFFDSIQQMVSVLLKPDSPTVYNISLISERQIEFVRSLKQINRHKKNSHVKFMIKDAEIAHCPKKIQENIIGNEFYFKLIDQLTTNIFQDYANYITVNSSKDLIDKLCSLVLEFDKKIFFDSLMVEMKYLNKDAKLLDIYEHLLKKWLTSENTYCKSVINLIFLLMLFLEDTEKEIVLNDLTENNQPNCLLWSLSTALSDPHVDNVVVQKWLKEEKIGLFLISIAEKQISSECAPELAVILKLALTENMNGDLFISPNVLTQIMEKIVCTLVEEDTFRNLDACCSLAAHLCSIIYTDILLLTYGDKLLITLIQMTCKFRTEQKYLSLETIWEIKSAWRDALIILLNNLDKTESHNLVENIAVTIENQFFLASNKSKVQMEHLANVILTCIRAFFKSTSSFISQLVELIFKRPWMIRKIAVIELCKLAEYIKGNMGSRYGELLNDSLNEKEILEYFEWCFVKVYALCSEINTIEQNDNDQCTNNEISKGLPQRRLLDLINNTEDHLLDALYFYTVGESFLIHFTNVKYYKEILYYHSLIEKKLEEIVLHIDLDTLSTIKIKLRNNYSSLGGFWSKAEVALHKKFLRMDDDSTIYAELTESCPKNNPVGIIHDNQILKNDNVEAFTKLPGKVIDCTVINVFQQLEKLRQENLSEFLLDNLENISCAKVDQVIEAIRLCSKLVECSSLTRTYWDFIVISLASWVSNCLKARAVVHTFQYQSVLIAVSELYVNICRKVEKLKEENVNTDYVNEWEDVLLESIHADFAQIWLFLAEQLSTESENVICNLPLMQYFGPVTEHMRYEFIFKSNDKLPKWTKFLKRSCGLLTNSQTVLQLWGYRMLKMLIPGLIKIDTEAVDTGTPNKKGFIFEQFKEKLNEVQDVIYNMLMDFRVGENNCRVEPSYDSFTYTFAYLLLWDVMLCICQCSSAELRYQYSDWLKNGDFLQCFLSNLFKLVSSEIYQTNEGKTKPVIDHFLKSPLDNTCYNKFCDSETIEKMACYLYKTSLVQLPVLVRQWWTDLDMKAAHLVDKITTLYVSPHLCSEELGDVMQYQNVFKNMKVKVMLGIREILAVYTVDESQMELTITLPLNYPLGSPTIQCNKQISGANQKQWLLQFKKCVLHQNGRIWDALALWNNSLDRKFDGVEECYICYAILHFGTCQLPRLSCQTCKKKFHSACLYKWFSTSNKSSCPICRNLF